jgi:hypothetical protein
MATDYQKLPRSLKEHRWEIKPRQSTGRSPQEKICISFFPEDQEQGSCPSHPSARGGLVPSSHMLSAFLM